MNIEYLMWMTRVPVENTSTAPGQSNTYNLVRLIAQEAKTLTPYAQDMIWKLFITLTNS